MGLYQLPLQALVFIEGRLEGQVIFRVQEEVFGLFRDGVQPGRHIQERREVRVLSRRAKKTGFLLEDSQVQMKILFVYAERHYHQEQMLIYSAILQFQ